MSQSPVVQVRMTPEDIAFLDETGLKRSEAVRACVRMFAEMTRSHEIYESRPHLAALYVLGLEEEPEFYDFDVKPPSRRPMQVDHTIITEMATRVAEMREPPSFVDHPEGTCDDPACPRFACRKGAR